MQVLPSSLLSKMLYLYNRKDVRLPVQLQRAMAAEAEAAREARAKVRETLVVSLLEKLYAAMSEARIARRVLPIC